MNGWLTIKTRLLNNGLVKGLKDIKKELAEGTKDITEMTKHFAKMALIVGAIVGIFALIRGGIQSVLSKNEELVGKIEAIKLAAQNLIQGIFTAVGNLLEPIITKIINLVYTFMAYLNAITKAWFGLDLFAKSTSKSLKSGAKSAKEIKKSLAGFDEMNVLSGGSSSGGGGGTSGATAGPEIPDVQIPKWLQWVADNKDTILQGLVAIATAFMAIKWAGFVGGLEMLNPLFLELKDVVMKVITFIGENAALIGGIILIIGGLAIAIKGIIDYLNDPSWENFGKILLGIGVIAGGVFLIFGGIPALIALIVGAIVALGLAIYKNWDKIKEALGKAVKWVDENIIKPVGKWFSDLWQGIKDGVEDAVKWVKKTFNSVVSFFSTIIKKIVSAFKTIGTKVGDVIGGAFKAVINGVITAIEKILNFPIKAVNKLINVINKVPGIDIDKLPTFNLPKLARGGIVSNPGMGVNMGSYIAGERGPEAVLPLTDDTLQKLASMIPITIDLTNTIDGRVLNRRLETIRMNDSFAGNR